MKLQQYITSFQSPLSKQDAAPLLRLLAMRNKMARGLSDTVGPIDERRLNNPPHNLPEPWDGIALRHCACVSAYYMNGYQEAYSHQSQILSLFFRWLPDQSAWCLPVLFLLLADLRDLAEQADQSTYAATGKMPALEECTRTVSKAFSMCATDRTFKGSESRRVGVYHVACLSIKCYFKLRIITARRYEPSKLTGQVGKPNLCKNIIRVVNSDPKTPPVDDAPLPDQVTWHFYIGMLAFLGGDDEKATEELNWALEHCPSEPERNVELILTYLIPLRLLTAQFPHPILLARFPRLHETYSPFIEAIKSGNVREYDERLEWAQARLVGMSSYLAVERAREGCLRVLFRKAWTASGKSTRIPLSTFKAALELHGVEVDADEVECMVANMIARGFMKGYISHGLQMVVLGKTNPFPRSIRQ